VPLHPATLYEAAFALGACTLALALRPRRTTRTGGVFFAGTLVYAGGRVVSEFFRADARAATFTTGQAMSVFVLALALSLALRETDRRAVVTQNRGDGAWPSSPPTPR
jgi:prolipoprotein diacylglyceryltransferase